MAQGHDLRPHVEMWQGFVRMTGYAIAGAVLLLVLMAIFLL